MSQFIDSNLCCPDVVCYEVLDIEDGLQSLDSLPMVLVLSWYIEVRRHLGGLELVWIAASCSNRTMFNPLWFKGSMDEWMNSF
ncbi:hypothetical protein T12_14964 [Trichinella patagoniensis]|uniref:Uncharacterized protein n=1 Tax=Trichinella patagoniensis TaxID=990121 RepID=A0A0V1A6V1_9BILA|nr:hypothetical protein T12_14964 [Trichinella patagoniensis]